ncbi:hypothetical protein AYL44_03600 [Microbacterium oleivorans]|uniref:DUF3180 domain-containing protein n=1 Tax=Microbacterium oleivorans TaxID=273677 RepID=A0A177KFK9_9MICO|nr:hypothetical protein AYL44_03600 [Microbacterium oleivorans]
MSALASLGGIACLLFLDLEKTTRWGVPSWVLFSALIVSGVVGVVRGVRMWRTARASGSSDQESSRQATIRAARTRRATSGLPAIYFSASGGAGVLALLAGVVIVIIGAVRADSGLISTGVALGSGGFAIALVGLAAAAYFRSVSRPDDK